MTIAADLSNFAFSAAGVNTGGFTMRNKIINGAMVIDQRNAGASISATGYPVDRFSVVEQTSATFTAQQSTTAPAGFVNSLLITIGTGATATSTQYAVTGQSIEGLNCADLGFGSASAQTVTLSFWVRSSITGVYCASLRNSGGTRAYIKEYTISSANTWEYKTLTFSGDTSGTWLTTNGIGIIVYFDLGSGSGTPTGAADSWITTNSTRTTNQTNFINSSGATFYVTGVQLEKGTSATPFEYRNHQQELAMCQRYFCKTFDIGTAPGNDVTTAGALRGAAVTINASSQIEPAATWKFPVSMRSTPTITMYAPGTSGHTAGQWTNDGNAGSSANARNNFTGTESASFDNTGVLLSAGFRSIIHATASAEI